MNLLVKNATIVCPQQKALHNKKRDLYIKNGRLEQLGTKISAPKNIPVFSYKNLHISLGWFDSSVSFGEPGYEERETLANGLLVAAKSGFTDILLNANTNPLPNTGADLSFLMERTKDAITKPHPYGSLTIQSKGEALAELYDMKNAGAIAFYDYQAPIKNSNLLKIALLYAQNFNGLVCSFPEDKAINGKGIVHEGEVATKLGLKGIPALSEELQIARDLFILEYTGGKLHIPTISTKGAVKLIAEGKKKGLDVTASVALHNLAVTDEVLSGFDTNFKVRPPLRSKKDASALLKGLQSGTIDFVTTDHRPLDVEEKRVEFDNAAFGTLGMESAFGILHKLCGLDNAITHLTKGRERFGITAPSFEEGSQANFTLFDPAPEFEFTSQHIHSRSKNSLFLGEMLKGKVLGVLAKDKRLLNEG